jgi:hypothetical protein
MKNLGLRVGQEYAVLITVDKEAVGEITGKVVSENELITSVYTDDGETLLVLAECLRSSMSAVDYHLHKPRLRELIKARVAELMAMDDEADEEDPPAPLISDIPF